MELITCLNCSTENSSKAKFCKSCGERMRCETCNEPIEKESIFCSNCGQKVGETQSTASRNKIKLKKDADSLDLEMDFSDDVAKSGLSDLISNLTGSSGANLPNKQIEQHSSKSWPQSKEVPYEDVSNTSDIPTTKESADEYPPLNDLEMIKTEEYSEAEWIAVYAFYESDYGKSTFSKETVQEMYFSKRKTPARSKNFASNWKGLFKKYFTTVNTNTFRFKNDGIPHLVAIIKGDVRNTTKSTIKRRPTNGSNKLTDTKQTPKVSSTKNLSIDLEEFDFTKTANKPSLKDFFNEKGIGESSSERILAIAYYIIQLNKSPMFTEGNIDYAYKAIQLSNRINNLKQKILNLKSTKLWFKRVNIDGKKGWTLDRAGEIYFEDNFLNNRINSSDNK